MPLITRKPYREVEDSFREESLPFPRRMGSGHGRAQGFLAVTLPR